MWTAITTKHLIKWNTYVEKKWVFSSTVPNILKLEIKNYWMREQNTPPKNSETEMVSTEDNNYIIY